MPQITDILYDMDSSQLICISTGGPASDVTWLRDDMIIPDSADYPRSQSIVDTERAEYRNVLGGPASSFQGNFTCIVENVRGRASGFLVLDGEWKEAPTVRLRLGLGLGTRATLVLAPISYI